MTVILEFYIITDGGSCIFSKSGQDQLDQVLFAGFMSALNSFSKQMANTYLDGFSLGKSQFFIMSDFKLLFVVRTEVTGKEKEARKILKEMVAIFFKHFPGEMFEKNWEASRDLLGILDNEYAKFFEDKGQKMASLLGW